MNLNSIVYELTVQQAFEIEQDIVDRRTVICTSGYCRNNHNELVRITSPVEPPSPALPGLGGVKVTEHREKSFTYSDGTTIRCCAATDCGWTGRPGGYRHSDGMKGGVLYSPEVLDAPEPDEETSPDDMTELEVPTADTLNAGVMFEDEPSDADAQDDVEEDEEHTYADDESL